MKYSNDFGVGMMLKGGGHVAPVFFVDFYVFSFRDSVKEEES